ncbi:MAG: hypothetical protein KDD51_16885 [Bdellovibrionales bacterium]|nr:hypothetical protein [Bdellovibrionales bacterium]MCB0417267.1 hypothetical protein [Bdellovibrionales bacterium]
MKLHPLFFFFLFAAISASAYERLVKNEAGTFCCSKRYEPCELDCVAGGACGAKCAPQPACLAACLKEYCTEKIELCRRREPAGGGDIRYDGRLTGPGTVTFDISTKAPDIVSLKVIGLIYGQHRQTNSRDTLSKTMEAIVLPTASARFHLEVSPDQFRHWTRTHNDLTVGISLEAQKDAADWRYENLLTREDELNAQQGNFLVRGLFHYEPKKK